MNFSQIVDRYYAKFISSEAKAKCEKVIVYIAIISFIVHLLLIAAVQCDLIMTKNLAGLLTNPLSAIYTPFSFILLYEAYLLVYYLPKSTTLYIGKQYEIITLIIIRRIFKDFSNITISMDWFSNSSDVIFTLDVVVVMVLFYFIYLFYKIVKVNTAASDRIEILKFINLKKTIATALIPIFVLLAFYNFGHWIIENFFSNTNMALSIKNTNKIFFEEFFTVLIMIDVLLLLFSFLHTDKFNQVIRNSGFIISTILIKLSFNAEGILNSIITVFAVLIGVVVLYICNKYDALEQRKI